MTMIKPFQLGSISTGTLDPEDLIPRFADAIRATGGDVDTDVMRGHYSESIEIIEILLGILSDNCPPFVYFGAHPDVSCTECKGVKGDRAGICRTCNGSGEGADFGFWPDWDALDDCKELQFGHITAWTDEYQCMVTREDDNVIVMDLNRNILWTTT